MSEETVYKAEEAAKLDVHASLPAFVLIGVGIALLLAYAFDFHLLDILWPGFVIGPGLLLMWPAYKSTADDQSKLAFLAVPGAMIVTTGVLHDENGLQPEKPIADLKTANLARSFEVNAIGPALVAKHFLPLLRRDMKTVFAALSARVGSISDNQLGGWASYRASKAALNMLLKTAAIEHRRSRPLSVIAAIHPGTVNTRLSAPFQTNLPPGQLTSTRYAAQQIVQVIEQLSPDDSGGFFAWDGTPIRF